MTLRVIRDTIPLDPPYECDAYFILACKNEAERKKSNCDGVGVSRCLLDISFFGTDL